MDAYIAGVVLTAPSFKAESECVELARPFAQVISEYTRGCTIEVHWGYWAPTQEMERSIWVWAECASDLHQLEVLDEVQSLLIEWGHKNHQKAVALITTNKSLIVVDLVPA